MCRKCGADYCGQEHKQHEENATCTGPVCECKQPMCGECGRNDCVHGACEHYIEPDGCPACIFAAAECPMGDPNHKQALPDGLPNCKSCTDQTLKHATADSII